VCVCSRDNLKTVAFICFCLVVSWTRTNLGRRHILRLQVKVKVTVKVTLEASGSLDKVISYSVAGSDIPPAINSFLSRVSTLTRDIDIAILSVRLSVHLSVRLSVRNAPVSDENGLTYCHSFFHHSV